MLTRAFVVFGTAGIALLFSAGVASAQMANEALLKRGRTLWQVRGCSSCHAVGRKQAGPDLANVSQRRSREWLRKWLQDTQNMLASDTIAMGMLAEWDNIKMPGQKLSDQDVDALLAYIDGQSAKLRK